jgi:hypothetical protein
MNRRIGLLLLWLACPASAWAECAANGDTKEARAGAKAVCDAFPKADSVDVADGHASGAAITLSLPGADLTALLAKEESVRSFVKSVIGKLAVPSGGNFRLTVNTSGSKDRRLFVARGGPTVVGRWDDRLHEWSSLE